MYTVLPTCIFVPLHQYSCPTIEPKIIKARFVKRTTRLIMIKICAMLDRRKVFHFNSSRDNCQRS